LFSKGYNDKDEASSKDIRILSEYARKRNMIREERKKRERERERKKERNDVYGRKKESIDLVYHCRSNRQQRRRMGVPSLPRYR
jgi:DNA-binding protein H-NS